jgi:23S rRNA-intervening sequence protein
VKSEKAAGFSSHCRFNDFRFWIFDFGLGKHELNEELVKARTRKIALDIIELVESLPRSRTADVIGRQLLRSDVISKLAIVEEEADERIYWLELLIESKIVEPSRVNLLLKECNEIVAMVVASIKTLRGR